jgi:hypothetical protein
VCNEAGQPFQADGDVTVELTDGCPAAGSLSIDGENALAGSADSTLKSALLSGWKALESLTYVVRLSLNVRQGWPGLDHLVLPNFWSACRNITVKSPSSL